MRRLRNFLSACLTGVALVACAAASPNISDMSRVSGDEILLVGKIELNPPLLKSEQNFSDGIGFDVFENGIGFYLGDAVVLPGVRYQGKRKSQHLVGLGKDFFIKSARSAPLYYSAPFMRLSTDPTDVMRFPGALRFEFPAGAKAVYIGTIRYHRNEYLEITKAETLDEFPRVRKEFEARFGRGVSLTRAKVSPVQK